MRSDITPGQTSKDIGFDPVDDTLPDPGGLRADRGYGSDKVHKTMAACKVVPVIPMLLRKAACGRCPLALPTAKPRGARLERAEESTTGGRPFRQDRRKVPRDHIDPPMAPTYVNIT